MVEITAEFGVWRIRKATGKLEMIKETDVKTISVVAYKQIYNKTIKNKISTTITNFSSFSFELTITKDCVSFNKKIVF